MPLIPIALATGWSGLVVFVLGLLPGPLEVDLNPMSVTLGALVIAISTEFSVLLSARYRQERDGGAGPARAIELTYASTGAAVLASGATAIAGFAALIVSDIRMLRDFGIVTVVDLTVSLLGVHDRAAGRAPVGRGARALPRARPARSAQAEPRPAATLRDRAGERGPLRGPRGRRAAGRARPHAPGARRAGRRCRAPGTSTPGPWASWSSWASASSCSPQTLPNKGKGLEGPGGGHGRCRPFAAPSAAGRHGGRRERLPEGAAATRTPGKVPACDGARRPGS